MILLSELGLCLIRQVTEYLRRRPTISSATVPMYLAQLRAPEKLAQTVLLYQLANRIRRMRPIPGIFVLDRLQKTGDL
jgi:hypothetical protein